MPTPEALPERSLFVSWIRYHGRSDQLSRALGAEPAFVAVGRLINPRTAPFRHLCQAFLTLLLLLRRRPHVLYVMAPPALLVLLGLVWKHATGARLVVDCHSAAVLGRPLSARLAARADLVLVTLPALAAGFPRAVPLHDPPVQASSGAANGLVVFPASWFADEPVGDVLAAARLLPHRRFAITGQAPAGLDVPANVTLTGHLSAEHYGELIAGCRLVLALTTRDDTMQRAAYEAVGHGRPVVASDRDGLRSYLQGAAVYTRGGGADLARAIEQTLERQTEIEETVRTVRAEQAAAFDDGLAALTAALQR